MHSRIMEGARSFIARLVAGGIAPLLQYISSYSGKLKKLT
jgi:hypothetical protein